MWDPNRYVDTDFGLTPEESFEPDDDERTQDDLDCRPHIMTLLGPIAPEDLGVCQHAEYLLHGPGTDAGSPEITVAADELEAYFTVGGRSMVDISLDRPARNVLGLRTLAQLVPVHIIAATGALATGESIEREIEHGIDNTGIKPGIVVCNNITGLETNAAISTATGLPHMVMPDGADQVVKWADMVESAGGDIARTLFSMPDADLGSCLSVIERGGWVSLDRIGAGSDDRVAKLVADLVNAGQQDRILLSQRLSGPSSYVTRGGRPGWIHILERFTLDLMTAGLSGDQVRTILVDNQARALTIQPHGTSRAGLST